jgi:sulfite exporter TauE/SafE
MPDFSDASFLTLIAGFFTAGFLGSWHCGVMCGPSACFMAEKKQLLPYQAGRLISYASAGAFSGYISQFLTTSYEWLKYVSVGVCCALLIFMFLTQNKKIATPKRLSEFYFKNINSGFLMGLATVLLPCGWLYSFIVSALAARSAVAGAIVMTVFWASSLPALSVAQLLMKKLINKNDQQKQRISSFVLLIASLYSFLMFLTH